MLKPVFSRGRGNPASGASGPGNPMLALAANQNLPNGGQIAGEAGKAFIIHLRVGCGRLGMRRSGTGQQPRKCGNSRSHARSFP